MSRGAFALACGTRRGNLASVDGLGKTRSFAETAGLEPNDTPACADANTDTDRHRQRQTRTGTDRDRFSQTDRH
eukprot:13208105-Alexandrium_andersonii.AAC.1